MPSNQSSNPLISVVIPAYNAEKYIETAINSARSQSFDDIEIIVVNDGSTDSTKSIVERLTKIDSRVILYTQKNSGKPAIARNQGTKKAKGKYIAYLDADDVMLPGKIDQQLNLFSKHKNVALVFHNCDLISPNNEILNGAYLNQLQFLKKASSYLTQEEDNTFVSKIDFYSFASINQIGIQTSQVMIKRDPLLNEAEWFPEDMDIGEDVDLWLRIIMKYQIGYIDKVLSQYRDHSESITKNPERMILGLINVRERNLKRGHSQLSQKDKKVIKHQIALKYRNLAYHYYMGGSNNRKMAKIYYIRCLLLYPSIKHLLSVFKTLLPSSLIHNNHR